MLGMVVTGASMRSHALAVAGYGSADDLILSRNQNAAGASTLGVVHNQIPRSIVDDLTHFPRLFKKRNGGVHDMPPLSMPLL